VIRPTLREIKSPLALATLGAFFVPEPLGTCLILAAAIWWLCRKPLGVDFDILPEASEWRIDFYRFRAGQNAAILLLLPDRTDYSVMEKPSRIECRLARSTASLAKNRSQPAAEI
jgi:hypothetical protein